MRYAEIPVSDAYELQNAGGLVLVCTRGPDGRYDVAPVAWCCPLDYSPASKLILVLDTGHRTYADLSDSGEFAVALPTKGQMDLVARAGSMSGHDADKYAELGIPAFPAREVDARIPEGVAGWLECRLSRIVVEGTSGVVMGEVLRAEAVPDAWKLRVHYVREGLRFTPGESF
ncbi:MAG TPA: flavin reductase family protein [Spirochaetia bacterium]|nr:flavin reductase family protein [Spirochaetia bacterium]HRZ91177.1 flavin reductase family protein [Spirochaetia bacterium]